MVELNFLNISLVFICFIFIVCFIFNIILKKQKKAFLKQKKEFSMETFKICNLIIDQVIDDYKITIFEVKINQLISIHDTNPKSKTNAISLFQKKEKNLFKESAKTIIEMLNKNTYDNLLNYYSQDSLILYIINKLKR